MLGIVKMTLCALVWRRVLPRGVIGFPTLMVCTAIAAACVVLNDFAMAGAAPRFAPYGFSYTFAWLALTLAAGGFFVGAGGRITFLSALMVLLALTTCIYATLTLGMRFGKINAPNLPIWASYWTGLLLIVWWLGAVCTLFRAAEPERRLTFLRAASLWIILFAVGFALPYEPVFRHRDFNARQVNHYWATASDTINGMLAANEPAAPPRRYVNHSIELAQPALLDAQLARLAPPVDGRANLYAIGLAGSSAQGVFVKEMDGGLAAIARVLPIENRVVRLANHIDTADTVPAASRQNFAAAVHAVAGKMDLDRDVLLLFMTSHGSPDGVELLLEGTFFRELSPGDVAAVLDREGIKNRIVIVSACYGGVFVKPLANQDSVVLTAADDRHTSFGCSNERDWTYFGEALFARSIVPGGDIKEAFLNAKTIIGKWEARDGLTSSNPQGFFGAALMEKLKPLYLNRAAPGSMAAKTTP